MRSASSSSGTTELTAGRMHERTLAALGRFVARLSRKVARMANLADAAIAPLCNNADHAAVRSRPTLCVTLTWGASCLAHLLLPGWQEPLYWPS
jgi:hypothetical protein